MKKKNMKLLPYLIGTVLLVLVSCNNSPSWLSLEGEWNFALDPDDIGVKEQWQQKELFDKVQLPGSLQEQGKGEDVSIHTHWTGAVVDKSWYTADEYAKYREPGNVKVPFWLNPDKYYTGVAWYQREIEIPDSWSNFVEHWNVVFFRRPVIRQWIMNIGLKFMPHVKVTV